MTEEQLTEEKEEHYMSSEDLDDEFMYGNRKC